MKSRGKSRLLCFRPVCQEDGFEDSKIKLIGKKKSIPDPQPVFSYISVSTSDIGISENAANSRKEEIVVETHRRGARHILARVLRLKIAEFQSDTATVKNRKLQQDAIADTEKNAAAVKVAPQQEPCGESLEGDAGKPKAVSSGSSPSLSSSGRKNSGSFSRPLSVDGSTLSNPAVLAAGTSLGLSQPVPTAAPLFSPLSPPFLHRSRQSSSHPFHRSKSESTPARIDSRSIPDLKAPFRSRPDPFGSIPDPFSSIPCMLQI